MMIIIINNNYRNCRRIKSLNPRGWLTAQKPTFPTLRMSNRTHSCIITTYIYTIIMCLHYNTTCMRLAGWHQHVEKLEPTFFFQLFDFIIMVSGICLNNKIKPFPVGF